MPQQNPLAQLSEHFDAIVPELLLAAESDARLEQLVQDTAARLHEDADLGQLRTVVFGQYNAGKSTFLNALLGEERAPMGDVPLTAALHDYAWEGHLLTDSPGIDAPITHQAVTDAFISDACHAVVFVVPTGGAVEEEQTWSRLCSFVEQKKAVIVVINDKDGYPLHGPEYAQARDAVLANLQRAAKERGLRDALQKIQVLHVKAKMALRGKVEGKEPLVAASGIRAAEAALRRFLSDGTAKMLAANRDRARAAVAEVQRRLAEAAGGSTAGLLAECREAVKAQQVLLARSLAEMATALVAREIDAIEAVVKDIDGPPSEVSVLLSNAMERSQARLHLTIGQNMQAEIARRAAEVEQATAKLQAKLRLAGVDAPNVELRNGSLPKGGRSGGSQAHSKVGSEILGSMKKLPTEKWTKDGVESLLRVGKKQFPEMFKGIGKKTMEKWATAAGKAVGPVLVLATAAYEIWNAGAADRKEREKHERFIAAVMGEVRETFALAKEEYATYLAEVACKVFAPLVAELEADIARLSADDAQRARRMQRISAWEEELERAA